jgi:ADP-ribosyl-[dinitrogen reductase] hydrolase
MFALSKDRVFGMFLGVAIGDALGLPVETMTAEKIAKHYGRISSYQDITDNPFFSDSKAGEISDDTQLSIVVAESLIACGEINLDDLARRHVEAMNVSFKGWGGATRKAVRRLAFGCDWLSSGEKNKAGNGVVMKIAPLGIYLAVIILREAESFNFYRRLIKLAKMTHSNDLAVDSAITYVNSIAKVLLWQEMEKKERFTEVFLDSLCQSQDPQPLTDERFSERIYFLRNLEVASKNGKELAELFGGATCFVCNSLPFVYAMFLRNPWSIETLYDTVSAGGDTDSNGSMVGALLGALNGQQIFPKHLVDGLLCRDQILDLANRFCDRFGIE